MSAGTWASNFQKINKAKLRDYLYLVRHLIKTALKPYNYENEHAQMYCCIIYYSNDTLFPGNQLFRLRGQIRFRIQRCVDRCDHL